MFIIVKMSLSKPFFKALSRFWDINFYNLWLNCNYLKGQAFSCEYFKKRTLSNKKMLYPIILIKALNLKKVFVWIGFSKTRPLIF